MKKLDPGREELRTSAASVRRAIKLDPQERSGTSVCRLFCWASFCRLRRGKFVTTFSEECRLATSEAHLFHRLLARYRYTHPASASMQAARLRVSLFHFSSPATSKNVEYFIMRENLLPCTSASRPYKSEFCVNCGSDKSRNLFCLLHFTKHPIF